MSIAGAPVREADTAGNEPPMFAKGVTVSFGGVRALDNVSLEVRDDELLAIIGPNGAGKTSLLNVMGGFYDPDDGRIFFNGTEITGMSEHRIARMGVGRTFQGVHLFPGLTVLENVMVGRYIHQRSNVFQAFVHFPWTHREEVRHREAVEDIIDFLELERFRKRVVGELGYGIRKRVDLGRALAMEPKVLLLDEPMAGMNLEEKEDLARFILDIREYQRIPVVLVEHDMHVVMDIADRVAVLDFGRLIGDGAPEKIQQNPEVIKAYLGSQA